MSDVLFRFRLAPDAGFDFLNEAITILTGYPLSDFYEDPNFLARIIHPTDRARFKKLFTSPIDGAAVLSVICRDGVVRRYDFHFVHIITLDRQLQAVEGSIHRRLEEQELENRPVEETVNERVRYFAEKLNTAGKIGMTLAEKLTLPDIYTLMSASIMELFPDLRMMTIARYHLADQQLECVSAVVNNDTVDISAFPRVPLEPPGKGTQSEAIHTRRPVIIDDLAARQRKLSSTVLVSNDEEEDGSAPQSALCVPMLAKGDILGVVMVQSAVLNRFTHEDAEILSIVANTAAVAMQNAMLVGNLEQARKDIQVAYEATLEGLSRALEIRDQETEGHTRRVAELARRFGRRLRLNDKQLDDLWRGAILHDIGKIGVPDSILNKPGPLTEDEWVVMRKHAEYGFHILRDVPFLKNSLEVPHYHHEKWDGSGYPIGLKGEEIPLAARLFAILDVWDALTSDRPYRKAWSREKALAHIREQAGKHFEPRLVELFSGLIETRTNGN